jgi:hypothetical protein
MTRFSRRETHLVIINCWITVSSRGDELDETGDEVSKWERMRCQTHTVKDRGSTLKFSKSKWRSLTFGSENIVSEVTAIKYAILLHLQKQYVLQETQCAKSQTTELLINYLRRYI